MKKIILAVLGAFGLASAAPFAIWGADPDEFPSLQVKTPEAVACWSGDNTADYCYANTAGWWWGYTDQDATVKIKLNGAYTEFAFGTGITDESDGSSFIDDALDIQFSAGAGESSSPTIAGIGFNHKSDETGQNIANCNGYSLTYTSTGALQFELGWDEDTYGYDTWYVTLPARSSKGSISMPWSDFAKDTWATGIGVQPITTATGSAVSVKIRLKNGTPSPVSADFKLFELGFLNDGCYGGPSIISGNVANANLKLSLSGKMLSMTVKEQVPVQIINLQGAVVHSQTYAPSQVMNLSNLPTGIYMVRVPALGYSGKIILK